MFYDKFMELCAERNVKPSPILKKLGLSSGNLKRWEAGANVNSDTLKKLSEYFQVPVDYFLDERPGSADIKAEIPDDANVFRKIYWIFKSHPDNIASFLNGTSTSEAQLKAVAEYLGCSVDYLLDKTEFNTEDQAVDIIDKIGVKDYLLGVMNKLPSNAGYQVLQVKISYIIMNNLEKVNIGQEELIRIKLASKKIERLYNKSIPNASKRGLNFSDLNRIVEAFDLSYDFLFTGK